MASPCTRLRLLLFNATVPLLPARLFRFSVEKTDEPQRKEKKKNKDEDDCEYAHQMKKKPENKEHDRSNQTQEHAQKHDR
jgi:hypothetical protein